jgi:small-conductance mechanosensitive channel
MHLAWGWQFAARGLVVCAAAILTAELAHYLLYASIRRFQKWRDSFVVGAILRYTSRPVRLLLILVALSIVLPQLGLPAWAASPANHVVEISYIVALTWLASAFIEIIYAIVDHRLPANIQDDVRARRTRTQVQLLRQIVIGLVFFLGFAAILMTFPSIRSLGAGLFASAGVAGLVLGMAARPTLGNLIAGIQIALTEPIRIDDAVVVEGEFGRVVEVNTTYVVIRLWDLRHLIVPISHFIEKPFQNWTRYSSELIGAVFLYVDYTVPVAALREEYKSILESSPLWDGKTMAVQVTDAKESTMQIRFLMSAANASSTFDLRCYVREKIIDYLQKQHPAALPRMRADVALTEPAREP